MGMYLLSIGSPQTVQVSRNIQSIPSQTRFFFISWSCIALIILQTLSGYKQ